MLLVRTRDGAQCALKQTSFKPHTTNFANQWKAFESAKITETPASTKSLVSKGRLAEITLKPRKCLEA